MSKAVRRAARWAATRVLVACSSPSGVKYMTCASVPNFAAARSRRPHLGERRRDLLRGRGAAQLLLHAQLVATRELR